MTSRAGARVRATTTGISYAVREALASGTVRLVTRYYVNRQTGAQYLRAGALSEDRARQQSIFRIGPNQFASLSLLVAALSQTTSDDCLVLLSSQSRRIGALMVSLTGKHKQTVYCAKVSYRDASSFVSPSHNRSIPVLTTDPIAPPPCQTQQHPTPAFLARNALQHPKNT